MFHSNQELVITRDLKPENIKLVLDFVEQLYGHQPNAFQITPDNRFVLGKIYSEQKGWQEFQFGYDSTLAAHIIYKHFENMKISYEYGDGGYHKGFKVQAVDESLASESHGIKNPFYAIVEISPFTTYYSK